MTPHFSCVMATGDRPAFFRQALRCFLRQTYADSELIVVDDGDVPVADLCAGLLRVKYLHVPRAPLGTKLNMGIAEARGEVIQKLDDDDFYHESFLATAATHLAGRELVAWDCFLVLLQGERGVRFSGHGWAAGGTLCFRKPLWRRTPFRDVPRAVDHHFLADCGVRPQRVCAPEKYLLVRHGTNTWKTMHGAPVEEHFRAMPRWRQTLPSLVEPIDLPFYQSLCESVT